MSRVDALIAAERPDRVDELRLHRAFAALTGNPVFELFVEILALLSTLYQAPARMSATRQREGSLAAMHIHRRIAEAIDAGDEDAASRRVARHLDHGRQFFTARQLDRTLGFADAIGPSRENDRLATVVARRIYGEIVARGWPVGELLGSEANLISHHDVSRAVLREAIRLLEFNGIVRTRRGVGGGTFIGAPSQSATVESMAIYLQYRGITVGQLYEVRQVVELATVQRAIETLEDTGVAALRAALDREQDDVDLRVVGHELHAHIAEITGNPVLVLLLNALTRLSEERTPPDAAEFGMTSLQAATTMHHAHERLVEAIVNRDAVAARRRMKRHLEALMPLQR
jgi:DNA-binding FadR family transcriptional regulator